MSFGRSQPNNQAPKLQMPPPLLTHRVLFLAQRSQGWSGVPSSLAAVIFGRRGVGDVMYRYAALAPFILPALCC